MSSGEHLKDIIGSRGKELRGKKVVLCITGSVAAVESPGIARELMRHGAEVIPVMSKNARQIIHPDLMEWATGNQVVTRLTGRLEHIELAGHWRGRADLILVAPCSSNTISKIACAIDDTSVTTIVSTGLGTGVPIVIAPAMHISLYDHPIIREHVRKMRSLGIDIVEPKVEEGKAKIATSDEIIRAVIGRLATKDMDQLKVLVTAGTTYEFLDPIRFFGNKSSGKMGIALAEEASVRGADVTLLLGPTSVVPPPVIETMRVETTSQMHEVAVNQLKSKRYDIFLAAAAVADFSPEKSFKEKIESDEVDQVDVRLARTPKIIDEVKRVSPKTFLVAFKAEYKLPDEELITRAFDRLRRASADLIVVNDVAREGCGFGSETNEVFVVDAKKNVSHISLTTKREIGKQIFDRVLPLLKR